MIAHMYHCVVTKEYHSWCGIHFKLSAFPSKESKHLTDAAIHMSAHHWLLSAQQPAPQPAAWHAEQHHHQCSACSWCTCLQQAIPQDQYWLHCQKILCCAKQYSGWVLSVKSLQTGILLLSIGMLAASNPTSHYCHLEQ